MTGIENATAKLAWAEGHLDLLDSEITKFADSNPYTLTREDDLEHGRHVLRFKLQDVPLPICLIAGDAVYSMRASLDQMVWGLAGLNGNIPRKHTQFPVVDGASLTTDTLRSFKQSLIHVPPEAICEIDALQPYRRGAAYKTDPLWRLNELCNLDKHRRIAANGSEVMVHFPNISPADSAHIFSETSDDGVVFSVPIALKSKLDFDASMSFKVNFGGDVSGISEDWRSLLQIHEFVAMKVLPRFERFFV